MTNNTYKMGDLISKRLMDKLVSCGINVDELLSVEGMTDNDRYYLDIATDGVTVSYITEARFNNFETSEGVYDFWNEELRRKYAYKTKPGRVFQCIHGSELSYETQKKLKLMFFDQSNYEVMIVEGNDIAKYYNEDYYAENKGDLGNSCMRHCPSSFFEFYKAECKLVILMHKPSEKIVARAVLYPEVHSYFECNDTIKALGRIYASDDIYSEIVKNWALENDFFYFNGGYSATKLIGATTEYMISDYRPYVITKEYLPHQYSFTPYVDNFEYTIRLTDGRNIIATYDSDYRGEYYEYESLHNTEGGYHREEEDYCHCCTFDCNTCWEFERNHWNRDDDCDYEDDGDWY